LISYKRRRNIFLPITVVVVTFRPNHTSQRLWLLQLNAH
jgi:hypothetical protein